MKLPQKGWLLTALARGGPAWDEELQRGANAEYGSETRRGAIRLALEELAAAGLVQHCSERLDSTGGRSRLSFRYRLTPFGLERMRDTGLDTGKAMHGGEAQ
ncbi:MAG: hypothetical protein KGI67_12700 [Pseudomonadota bacterium]|nr:hypothetical protein [Pseudomonadota bacterium]